jgi:hypothetical protein
LPGSFAALCLVPTQAHPFNAGNRQRYIFTVFVTLSPQLTQSNVRRSYPGLPGIMWERRIFFPHFGQLTSGAEAGMTFNEV